MGLKYSAMQVRRLQFACLIVGLKDSVACMCACVKTLQIIGHKISGVCIVYLIVLSASKF